MTTPDSEFRPALQSGAGPGAAVARLASAASIEVATKNLRDLDGYAGLLPAGTDMFVPCLPGTPLHHILGVATRLREIRMNPVPHLAVRRIADERVAAGILPRLRDEAGVTRVMLIGGDSPSAAGRFASSLDFLRTGLLQAHGIRSVGLAAYPETHPRVGARVLAEALEAKLAFAKAHGLDAFVVSQFCFDGATIVRWLEDLRAGGVTVPVRIGIAGPASVRTLLSYGIRCGIGDSLRPFGSLPVSLPRLLMHHGPEPVVRVLAPVAERLGIAGLHCFPFGGFAKTARWIEAVAARGLPSGGTDNLVEQSAQQAVA